MGVLTIDLEAIQANYRQICMRVGDQCAVGAAVKANGYGLGLETVSSALLDAGAKHFFVANFDEALRARETLGSGAFVYTLDGYDPVHGDLYDVHHITPILNSL